MVEAIKVRIIPGCPVRVIAETEDDRFLVEEALANVECGCVVETEAAIEEAKAAEEAGEPTSELAEEAEPVCSIEPDKPWEESVCGVVAREAGRLAAEKVMIRLREEGLIA